MIEEDLHISDVATTTLSQDDLEENAELQEFTRYFTLNLSQIHLTGLLKLPCLLDVNCSLVLGRSIGIHWLLPVFLLNMLSDSVGLDLTMLQTLPHKTQVEAQCILNMEVL